MVGGSAVEELAVGPGQAEAAQVVGDGAFRKVSSWGSSYYERIVDHDAGVCNAGLERHLQ